MLANNLFLTAAPVNIRDHFIGTLSSFPCRRRTSFQHLLDVYTTSIDIETTSCTYKVKSVFLECQKWGSFYVLETSLRKRVYFETSIEIQKIWIFNCLKHSRHCQLTQGKFVTFCSITFQEMLLQFVFRRHFCLLKKDRSARD